MLSLRTCLRAGCLAWIVITLLAGCTSLPEPEEDRPLNIDEIRGLLARARDPRELWVTVYQGKSGPVFDNSFRVRSNQGGLVPMLGEENTPPAILTSTLRVEGIPTLLDPSSPDSWATLSIANALAMTPLGPPYYQVDAGHLETEDKGIIAHLSTLKLEATYVDSPLFVIRAATGGLEAFKRGYEDPEPLLVLGNDFLRTYRFVQFNFPQRRLVLATSDEYQESSVRLLTQSSLFSINGALGTEALVNGKKTTVLLDPAGDYGVAVPEAANEGRYRISIGDLRLPAQEAVSTESLSLKESEYPRLGFQVLKPYIMTLDYSNKIIWFEKPSE